MEMGEGGGQLFLKLLELANLRHLDYTMFVVSYIYRLVMDMDSIKSTKITNCPLRCRTVQRFTFLLLTKVVFCRSAQIMGKYFFICAE